MRTFTMDEILANLTRLSAERDKTHLKTLQDRVERQREVAEIHRTSETLGELQARIRTLDAFQTRLEKETF